MAHSSPAADPLNRYRVLLVDPADFYAVTPRRPLSGDILSAHRCRSLAMDAFYAAGDTPRESMVVLEYAGAVRTILAHSDNHLRCVTPS